MSRYLILIILNTPMVAAGILSSIVSYKLRRSNRTKFIVRLALWGSIFSGILFAEPLYNYLFAHNLTQTEPLSLFDVIQITGIIFTLFIANRAFLKADTLEQRIKNLHQELSIQLSKNKPG